MVKLWFASDVSKDRNRMLIEYESPDLERKSFSIPIKSIQGLSPEEIINIGMKFLGLEPESLQIDDTTIEKIQAAIGV